MSTTLDDPLGPLQRFGHELKTLAPLLPIVFTLRGKPLTLHNHYPMEPLFRVEMPRTLTVRAGRQVGKTLTIGARAILLCAGIPYFRVLQLAPLLDQSQRISNDHVRPLVEESPLRGRWFSTQNPGSVMRREFLNRSAIYFSYAFLTAERLRGYSGIDLVGIDESVPYHTPVLLATGETCPIGEIQPGDVVWSFDNCASLKKDVVVSRSYHGRRACFRVRCADGSSVEATSESWFATDRGWRRLSQIIEEAYGPHRGAVGRDQEIPGDNAGGAELATNPAYFGDVVGRREPGSAGDGTLGVRVPSRVGPTRVQLSQVPTIVCVCANTDRQSREQGLRRMVELLQNPDFSRIRLLRSPGLSVWNESRQPGVVGRVDLGGDSLLVPRRRVDQSEEAHVDVLDPRLHAGGGRAAGKPSRNARRHLQCRRGPQGEENLLGGSAYGRGYPRADHADRPVCSGEHAVQDLVGGPADDGRMPLLSRTVRASGDGSGLLLQEVGVRSRTGGGVRPQAPAGRASRRHPSLPASVSQTAPEAAREDLSAVSGGFCDPSGAERASVLLFDGLSEGGGTPEEPRTLSPVEIVGIEYAGEHDVYDIETLHHHTFFANGLAVHNCQDFDPAHVPVAMETMSASENFGMLQVTGTSKTKDGLLELFWNESSQAEWIIRCGCGFYNIAASADNGGHLERMLGPYRDDISEERPALLCARCGKFLQPRTGSWVHRYPERAHEAVGYHIPQPIMPGHYAKPEKWSILLGKQRGVGNYTTAKFYNECLGEAYDVATKLVNLPDLIKAGCLHENTLDNALAAAPVYIRKVLAVDWGGGGEQNVSFTCMAVLGQLPNGTVDVIYGRKLLTPHDHMAEAEECLKVFKQFQCNLFVHDYTGAGALRETFMVHTGMPRDIIMAIAYVAANAGGIINFKPSTFVHPREYWTVDKTRSLQLTCYALKLGKIRTFKYDYISRQDTGLLCDFMSLVENKVQTPAGSDRYLIQRSPFAPDDFAQAVNIGACAIWHMSQSWPTMDIPA